VSRAKSNSWEGRRQFVEGRSREALARTFHLFGRIEAPQLDSAIYAELSYGVSQDADLLALAAETRESQPPPNMLYAAVQYLLLRGEVHALSAHYPAISGEERPLEPAFPAFREFCLAHRDTIAGLLATRLTQTNVIQRCICLLPAFAVMHREVGRPLALFEVGPSAGLNLNWDRYHYAYPAVEAHGAATFWGEPDSAVQLTTVRRGAVALPGLPASIPVASRVGIDLHPIDPSDSDAVLWLRALIWPEHVERHERLLAALEIARQHPPPLIAGDAVERVPELLRGAPEGTAPVVFATHALYQVPRERRIALLKGIEAEASRVGRRIDLVSLEGTGPDYSELTLTTWQSEERDTRLLARASPHGRWLEWLPTG
jgi:hypothetical protein